MQLIDAETGEIEGQADEQALALVDDKFQFTPTGLVVQGDPTFDECEIAAKQIFFIGKMAPIWLGDLLNYMDNKWGESYAQILDTTKFAYQTVANAKSVMSRVPHQVRQDGLYFTHYRAVASLPMPQQERLLKKAKDEEINTTEFEQEVRQYKRQATPPILPVGVKLEKELPPDSMAVHYTSQSVEWLTPLHIVDCVLDALGEIDLDPCSNSHIEPNVPAAYYYTKEDDGLSCDWHGTVYMNPPYGRQIGEWVEHLCQQYESGNVIEAIALVPSRTDTKWFQRLRQYPRCFIWGRLQFSNEELGAPFPSMAVYLGKNLDRFVQAFDDVGDVYILLSTVKDI